jgi:hypothetical protein
MEYDTNISQKEGEDFLNNMKLDHWVFSYGGCGTNYIRRLVYQFTLQNRQFINRKTANLIKTVHLYSPPNLEYKNFVAIYVFGDPYLSFYSIFSRKLYKTINILSGQEIYKSKHLVNFKYFVQELNKDVLRLKSQFMNWYNSNTNYPIIFINYSKLNNKLLITISQILENKFKIKINKKELEKFKIRKSKIDNLTQEELIIFKKIYGIFREYLEDLPPYWIKYPETSIN